MQARMGDPATVIPAAGKAIYDLLKAARTGGGDESTLELVHLRASQINGCSFCVHYGSASARKAGVTDDQLVTVAGWRETPRPQGRTLGAFAFPGRTRTTAARRESLGSAGSAA